MGKEKTDFWSGLLFNLLAALSVLLPIYGYLAQTQWKIVYIIAGIISLYFYTRWWLKDFIAREVLIQKEEISQLNKNYEKIKEDVIYMKGWMTAINFFKGKKGVRGAIDPLTLFIAIVIIIVVILYLQGKL